MASPPPPRPPSTQPLPAPAPQQQPQHTGMTTMHLSNHAYNQVKIEADELILRKVEQVQLRMDGGASQDVLCKLCERPTQGILAEAIFHSRLRDRPFSCVHCGGLYPRQAFFSVSYLCFAFYSTAYGCAITGTSETSTDTSRVRPSSLPAGTPRVKRVNACARLRISWKPASMKTPLPNLDTFPKQME